jgi:CubicO group peptidase (beta-lactamase class C family)
VTLLDSTAARLIAATAQTQSSGRTPSLVAGVVREGGLVWSAGRGTVDGAVPDDDVQYRIGSITKTVTAIAVLRLRDEGRLRLGDPLETHLPGTPFGDRTIGQLLAHDAGLRAEAPTLAGAGHDGASDWWERVAGVSWPELAQRFRADADVLDAPGRRHHYSNLGYGALGEVVARVRGRSWAEVVRDEILLPLGMTRTTYRPQGRAARGYAVHPWADVLHAEPEHDAGAMAPAGQLWSTVADLARLAGFLVTGHGDVLPASTLREMADPGVVSGDSAASSGYGLGLQAFWGDGVRLVGHGGSMPGFLAGLLVEPAQRTAAVVLSNATSGPDTGGLARTLLRTVRELEPHVAGAWAPLADPDDAATREALELIGPWYWGPSGYGLRLDSDGRITALPLVGSGSRATRFERRGNGSWVGLEGYYAGEVLRPVRDASGAVIVLDIGTFVFSRTPYDPAAPIPGGHDPEGWHPGRP